MPPVLSSKEDSFHPAPNATRTADLYSTASLGMTPASRMCTRGLPSRCCRMCWMGTTQLFSRMG